MNRHKAPKRRHDQNMTWAVCQRYMLKNSRKNLQNTENQEKEKEKHSMHSQCSQCEERPFAVLIFEFGVNDQILTINRPVT